METPEKTTPVVEVPVPNPSQAAEALEVVVAEESDLDDDEVTIPAKLENNFVVEFIEAEKKKALVGSDDVGLFVSDVHFAQVLASEVPHRRKKRRKTQDEMPWHATITFIDDLDNKVADFIDGLRTQEGPFRVRIIPVNAQGRAVEYFVLKDATVKVFPTSYNFSIQSTGPRKLILQLEASLCRRKSLTGAKAKV